MKSHGAVYVDVNTWACTKCDYKAGFVSRNNIKVHMQSMQHLARVTKLNNGLKLEGGQTTILPSFAKTISAGRAEYPLGYQVQIDDIGIHDIKVYVATHLCHGFYDDFLTVSEV